MEQDHPSSVALKKVGDTTDPDAHKLRVVHISDTHLLHQDFIDQGLIPDGDVLVHSGDFSFFRFKRHLYTEYDYNEEVDGLRKFFDQLPHKYKIFVAGNHETNFPQRSVKEIQEDLPGIIYLQDDSVKIEGVKFYGSPWCGQRWYSFARSYVIPYSDLYTRWENIPEDVDVLVTHSPPFEICDLAVVQNWQVFWQKAPHCSHCGEVHHGWSHFGCKDLRAKVFDIRPKVHLFGHCHERNGFLEDNGVLFSNAAMKLSDQAHVIDVYKTVDDISHTPEIVRTGPVTWDKDHQSYCTVL